MIRLSNFKLFLKASAIKIFKSSQIIPNEGLCFIRFEKGKRRKGDRKEGGRAVRQGEKESIKIINKKSVCDECIRIYTNDISHIGSKNTILL